MREVIRRLGHRQHVSEYRRRALSHLGLTWSRSRQSHYWGLWTFVGLVSLYDAWLVVLFRDVIKTTEKNPVGLLLLNLDSGGLTYFLTAKLMGTAFVLWALVHVHRLLQRYRDCIIGGVASFQAWLLWYLSF